VDPLMLGLLGLSVLCSLGSRALMKRIAAARLGGVPDSLLEIDYFRATRGDPLGRSLLAVELLSWAATIVLTAALASRVLASG